MIFLQNTWTSLKFVTFYWICGMFSSKIRQLFIKIIFFPQLMNILNIIEPFLNPWTFLKFENFFSKYVNFSSNPQALFWIHELFFSEIHVFFQALLVNFFHISELISTYEHFTKHTSFSTNSWFFVQNRWTISIPTI